jgi:hypothetical protein
LRNVLGLGLVVHKPADQLQHPMLVLEHQQVERCLVARLNAPDQFVVGVIRGRRSRRQALAPCPTGSALDGICTTALID